LAFPFKVVEAEKLWEVANKRKTAIVGFKINLFKMIDSIP
jgi:hypothetical protein